MAFEVLGIDVADELVDRWCGLLAPALQPFFLGPDDGDLDLPSEEVSRLADDLRCTYTAWRIHGAARLAWLDADGFHALPRVARARLVRRQVDLGRGAVPTVRRWRHRTDVDALRAQADGHRFVWWPDLVAVDPEAALRDRIEDGQLASRHGEVDVSAWSRHRAALPGAREIVGRFPASSGPNCFGAVLAAAGAAPGGSRVVHEPFERFLQERCRPGGVDGDAGTVLVWRGRTGTAHHAAVTIGDGWGLEKPAETWWTPTIVATVADLVRVNRAAGLRLERHAIVG